PLNATVLPAPAAVPPIILKDTPGSLACAGPRGAEAVGAAQDDAVQQVARRGDAVGADAGEVALDDVLLPAVVHLDAGAGEADHVARPGRGAADGVEVTAADLDAEQVVALRRARGGGRP